jgi:alpha-L-fucosidase
MNSLPAKFDWFHKARYGMFIHWGAYAVAARGEWVRNRERIPQEEYVEKYVKPFTAQHYDPGEWARLARQAGMGYVVLTTRHHDGFCLWDSKTTDFNAARIGPKRDLLKPFVEAVRKEGLKVGFYYSVADWSHPDYPDAYARDWPTHWPDPAKRKRFIAFYRAQLEELMTGYGKIDVLWYDGCIPSPTAGDDTNERVYELQPHILINERNGAPFDFHCAEQSLNPKPGTWEACITLNDDWGYHAGDHNWKSPRQVIHSLITCARNGGNLLLNVGPRADGVIPEESAKILLAAGEWLGRNREFLPDSDRCPLSWNNWGLATSRGSTAYLHIFALTGSELCLAEIANPVKSVRFVDGGEPIPFHQKDNRLFLTNLPATLKDPIATTIAVEVEGKLQPQQKQETFWIPQ